MKNNKRAHLPAFKARVALELIRGLPMSEVCSRNEVHPTQAGKWKERALQELESVFVDKRKKDTQSIETNDKLYEEIGRLKVETDWLKKKLSFD